MANPPSVLTQVSPSKRAIKVLWPVEAIAPEALPGQVADVRFDILRARRRHELKRLFTGGHTGAGKGRIEEYLREFDGHTYAEVTIHTRDTAAAETQGRQRISAVIEVINFFADIGDSWGDGIFLKGELGYGAIARLAYESDKAQPPFRRMSFERRGPVRRVSIRRINSIKILELPRRS
jgi:hypothetical protein